MNATELLRETKVAAPCRARWGDMTGDNRVRFCAQCNKHVYNLSEMSAEAAEELIRSKEGKLCVRFYRRRDGTMLTANCPVGQYRLGTRMRVWATAVMGLLLTTFGVAISYKENPGWEDRGPLGQVYDDTLEKVKGWLGLDHPVVMGMMAAPVQNPPPPVPPQATSAEVTGAAEGEGGSATSNGRE